MVSAEGTAIAKNFVKIAITAKANSKPKLLTVNLGLDIEDTQNPLEKRGFMDKLISWKTF
jgi:hypothetical protein